MAEGAKMKRSRATPESYPIEEVAPCQIQSAWLQKNNSQQRLMLTASQFQLGRTKAIIRKATLNDIYPLYELYKIVARVNRGNLTQEKDEKRIPEVSKKMIYGYLVLIITQKE